MGPVGPLVREEQLIPLEDLERSRTQGQPAYQGEGPVQASGAPTIPNAPRNKQPSLLQPPAGSWPWLSPAPAHQWLQHGGWNQATPESTTTQYGSYTAAHYQVITAAADSFHACSPHHG